MSAEKFMKNISNGVKLVGRSNDFRGQTLWEIVSNLRNFGVGRIVVRNKFQRYEEPCYMRVLNVEVQPHEEVRKVRVVMEKTWRGIMEPKPITIYSSSYKADYVLVPKEDEDKYINNTKKVHEKVLPLNIDFPPLFREFIKEESGNESPLMSVHFKKTRNKHVRLAKETEKSSIQISMKLGTPISKTMYEGVL